MIARWGYHLMLIFNTLAIMPLLCRLHEVPIFYGWTQGLSLGWILLAFAGGIAGIWTFGNKLAKQLPRASFDAHHFVAIEPINHQFLPSYLGYFFVALGINDATTFWVVFMLLWAMLWLAQVRSQTFYFNPYYLLMGYQFYQLTTAQGAVVLLISRRAYRLPQAIVIACAYQINGYTYLEMETR